MTNTPPRLRIACSGLVAPDNGSAASMGFEVLQELLRRGHRVDFFSKRTYVYPRRLLAHPGFTYYSSDQPWIDSAVARLHRESMQWLGIKAGNAVYMRRIVRAMARQHRMRPYDVELFLGQWAYGRVARLPVVSWVQGAPASDARSVLRHRRQIRELCGWIEYAKLRAYSGYRGSRLGRPPFQHTDVSICGSLASKALLVRHFELAPSRIRSLPYPIDLETFRPAAVQPTRVTPELLWVGRIVPRKRLDLFLDAAARVIRAGTELTVTVVGGHPFARGFHGLIESFPFPDMLTYTPSLSREEVRLRLQRASMLVAPSEEEDFGSSIAEALACGTPVVVGPSNGTGEYIEGGGERFTEYSALAVAGSISRILALSRADAQNLRSAARAAAVTHFRVDRVVDRLEDVLRSSQVTRGESP